MGRSKRNLEDLYNTEGNIPSKKSLASLHWEESKRDRTTELEEMVMKLQQEVDKADKRIADLEAALREAHLDSRIEQSATDQHIKTTHKFQQQLREAKERIAELEAKAENCAKARREAFERTKEAAAKLLDSFYVDDVRALTFEDVFPPAGGE